MVSLDNRSILNTYSVPTDAPKTPFDYSPIPPRDTSALRRDFHPSSVMSVIRATKLHAKALQGTMTNSQHTVGYFKLLRETQKHLLEHWVNCQLNET